MDGMAAVGARMATIQRTIEALSAPTTIRSAPGLAGTAGTAATTSGASVTSTASAGSIAPGPGARDFASVLAAQTAAGAGPAGSAAAAGAATVAPATPLTPLPGFTSEQLGNARAVVDAGRAMGLSLRDQAIGVMTAMGESSLRVLDHGDRAGPDSRGLFQQRDNGAWGTYAQRMDPTASATSFFTALARVGGRDSMTPTLVAHTVQRNADPNHYARYWDDAVRVVAHLTGTGAAQITGGR